MRKLLASFMAAATLTTNVVIADACTRFAYKGGSDAYYVGRSMDWMEDPGSDLWAFPVGMTRDGGVGQGSIEWTSRHSSVIASMYGLASVDGINDAGLAGNTLYLAESDYGDAKATGKPLLSIGAWLQYALDNYSTVNEAVEALSKEPFAIVAPVLPNGHAAHGHLALSDRTGDNAVFEYIDGQLHVHHGKAFNVMTNSPTFDQQLAIATYWDTVGGINFLPGAIRASDRFARTNWFVNSAPVSASEDQANATAMSLIRAISVPLGIADPNLPNIAATRWRTVSDMNTGRYFFDSVSNPSVFWVDLDKLKLTAGSPVLKLDLHAQPLRSGEVSAEFKPSEPFKFLAP